MICVFSRGVKGRYVVGDGSIICFCAVFCLNQCRRAGSEISMFIFAILTFKYDHIFDDSEPRPECHSKVT